MYQLAKTYLGSTQKKKSEKKKTEKVISGKQNYFNDIKLKNLKTMRLFLTTKAY